MNNDYNVIKIKKKNGDFRIIHAPKPALKKKQKEILETLKSMRIHPGRYIHAYFYKRSIKTNAEALLLRDNGVLRSPDYILKLDVENFFTSASWPNIRPALYRERVPIWLRNEIRKYCFIGHPPVLPQGAPTSPFLSSLLMKRVASMIMGLLKKWNRKCYCPAVFSIYCDNITVASDDPKIWNLKYPIAYLLEQVGLNINSNKTEFHKKPAPLVVCGVQINDKIGPPRSYWRSLRADLHNALTDLRSGLAPAGFYIEDKARKTIREKAGISNRSGLRGIGSFDSKTIKWWGQNSHRVKPVPFETWRGKIAFVQGLDPAKGASLRKKFDELMEATCRGKGSSSGAKPTNP